MEFEYKVLAKEILSVIYETGKTIGTAESCTAGKIASAIAAVPGASNYFKGGIVCYATDVKTTVLGVSQKAIDEHTVVSEEVARQMVKGVVRVLGVDYAVAVTGVAGPAGGTPEIPVGTIWIACGNSEEQVCVKLTEDNGRDQNLTAATHTALSQLLQFISEREKIAEDEGETNEVAE